MQNKNNRHSENEGIYPGRTASFLMGHQLLIHYSAAGPIIRERTHGPGQLS